MAKRSRLACPQCGRKFSRKEQRRSTRSFNFCCAVIECPSCGAGVILARLPWVVLLWASLLFIPGLAIAWLVMSAEFGADVVDPVFAPVMGAVLVVMMIALWRLRFVLAGDDEGTY